MRVIYRKIRHARYLYIKRNVEKVWGSRHTLGARYLSKNTVYRINTQRDDFVQKDCNITQLSTPTHAQLQRHRLKFIKKPVLTCDFEVVHVLLLTTE